MKLSHNFMAHLASMPVVANDDSSFNIGDNYVLEKTASKKRCLINRSDNQFAIVSSLLFGTFVQALTS